MPLQFEDTAIAFRYRSDKELKKAQLLFALMGNSLLTRMGLGMTKWALSLGLPVKGLIRNTIFSQFCGGETLEDAGRTAELLGKYRVGAILDYGVEGKGTETEFDHAVPEFIRAIEYAASKKHIPFISIKVTGFASFSLLEKVHSGATLGTADAAAWARVEKRIAEICAAAAAKQVMVLIDAEESWIQEPVDRLALEMMKTFNRKEAIVFNTYQMYLHARPAALRTHAAESETDGYILGAKLVRGAYMEKERRRAAEMGYKDPVQPDKTSTDRDFDEAVAFCLERLEKISVFIGTHNERSCRLAADYMLEAGISPGHRHVCFSQLYGMSDNISFNLADAGFHVSKYLPYGPVKDVIPYLARRAEENTSVKGQTGRELTLINRELERRKKERRR